MMTAIFYSIKHLQITIPYFQLEKKLAANSKWSSLNVQAQIVSKQTYLHQEIKTKVEGKHKINAQPPSKSPLCQTFFHKDDMFAS